MVEAILFLLKLFIGISILQLVLGLIKPVYVLWFLDRSNRLKVLKIFGTAVLLLSFIYFCVALYFEKI